MRVACGQRTAGNLSTVGGLFATCRHLACTLLTVRTLHAVCPQRASGVFHSAGGPSAADRPLIVFREQILQGLGDQIVHGALRMVTVYGRRYSASWQKRRAKSIEADATHLPQRLVQRYELNS